MPTQSDEADSLRHGANGVRASFFCCLQVGLFFLLAGGQQNVLSLMYVPVLFGSGDHGAIHCICR